MTANLLNEIYPFASAKSKNNETTAEKKDSWLALCVMTRAILKKNLDALAIDTVEVM